MNRLKGRLRKGIHGGSSYRVRNKIYRVSIWNKYGIRANPEYATLEAAMKRFNEGIEENMHKIYVYDKRGGKIIAEYEREL